MQILPAEKRHAGSIATLLTELGYPSDPEFALEKVLEFSARESSRVLVAEYDTILVGVVCFDVQPLFHQPGNIGTVMALCVSEQFRGNGIGRALMDKVEKIAQEMGCVKIAVASGVQRTDAHRFYLGLGYEEITKRFVKNLLTLDGPP